MVSRRIPIVSVWSLAAEIRLTCENNTLSLLYLKVIVLEEGAVLVAICELLNGQNHPAHALHSWKAAMPRQSSKPVASRQVSKTPAACANSKEDSCCLPRREQLLLQTDTSITVDVQTLEHVHDDSNSCDLAYAGPATRPQPCMFVLCMQFPETDTHRHSSTGCFAWIDHASSIVKQQRLCAGLRKSVLSGNKGLFHKVLLLHGLKGLFSCCSPARLRIS